MTFLRIERDYRSGKIDSYKLVTREELLDAHVGNADLAAWSRGARMGSRFSLTTSNQRLIYVRTDTIDEEMIKGIELL